jgi:hypothetical protein
MSRVASSPHERSDMRDARVPDVATFIRATLAIRRQPKEEGISGMSASDRQREAFERNKNRSPGKVKAKRDWLPVIISTMLGLLSLAVSFSGFFFSTLYHRDDIRVVIGKSPMVSRTAKSDLVVEGSQELTFVNSGNRAASITAVYIVGRLVAKGEVDNCEGEVGAVLVFPLEMKPVIIKPGEIVAIDAKFPSETKGGKTQPTIPASWFEFKIGDTVLACLALDVVTPDSLSKQWRQPGYRYTFKDSSLWSSTERVRLFEEKPLSVLRHTSTIFN